MIFTGLSSAVFYVAFQGLIRSLGSSRATLILYLIPIFAVFWAYLLLGEHLSLQVFVGGAIALLGVWIVNSLAHKESAEIALVE